MRIGTEHIPRIKLSTVNASHVISGGGGGSETGDKSSLGDQDKIINITLLKCQKRDYTVSKRSCQCYTNPVK